ncbi:peptidase U32 family protein [Oribacterium sp. NK2B42]|uniref:peptidase U32 family protein n=1 Tax=Oribacterium sp. NK2B42 TaxID=689781 RepID=UPI00041DB70B|nr:U32 family peptidase [Oribacterium sp. NK2B42]
MLKETELLIPAGSLDVLKTAVNYGANAVYLGGEAFGLRANAKNFTLDEIREGVQFAHERNVKVFVTANILAHNGDMEGVREYFKELATTGIDAVLIADPGVFMIAKEVLPDSIELHISTQANNTNYETFLFWWKLGAKRVVCARELSLKEIKEIRQHIPEELDIEAFIHGAMCMSYSGRCMLSNYFTGRDANRGECTHPCRWKYNIVEETRPGQYFPIYENERGTFIFNSKDLCMIEHVPELIDAGIDSLKIEGRMKTALYVATVARTYRKALDDLKESEEKYRANMEWYKSEIAKCTYREFTTGFYYGKPSADDHIYDNNTYVTGSVYLGTIKRSDEEGWSYLEQKNKFSVGEMIEIMKPNGEDIPIEVLEIRDAETDVPQDSCPHACQQIKVRFSIAPEAGDIIRKTTPEKQDVE